MSLDQVTSARMCVCLHALICALVHLSAEVDTGLADIPEWSVCVHGPVRSLTKPRWARRCVAPPGRAQVGVTRPGPTHMIHSIRPDYGVKEA